MPPDAPEPTDDELRDRGREAAICGFKTAAADGADQDGAAAVAFASERRFLFHHGRAFERAKLDAELAPIGPPRLTDDESRRLESRLCAHGGGAAVSVADRLTLAVCLERLRQYEKRAANPQATSAETKACPECGGSGFRSVRLEEGSPLGPCPMGCKAPTP